MKSCRSGLLFAWSAWIGFIVLTGRTALRYNDFSKSKFVGVAIYETDRAYNRI